MCAKGDSGPEQLLARARNGQSDCLGPLLEIYRNYLYLLARTQIDLHVQGRVNPSDVVQETFLQACRKFGQFRGSSEREWLGWLRRILLNNLARVVEKQMRAKKRDVRREVSLDERVATLERSSAAVEAALASECSSPSHQARRRERVALVADQLARLPADYRDVIVLRNLEGLSFKEVAKRMERSPSAVRALWLRALEQLREQNTREHLA